VRLLILGCGNAGLEVAARGKALGWEVVGTTTTPARVDEIEQVADRGVVLVGSDRDAVREAAEGADAILVSVSPPALRSATVEDRARTYREVLVESTLSAAAACDRVVFMSSISVYGDGTQEPGEVLTEASPRSTDDDPSTRYFSAAEDAVLANPGGTVLRMPDMYGHPRDIDFASRVRLAHDHMGGSVPFSSHDRYHPIHVDDVGRATLFVLEHGLTGAYNCVPDAVSAPTVGEFWDAVADASGQPRLEFRHEIRTPLQQASSARLRAAGFTFEHQLDEVVDL
jgi:nucleoside-diphosphate-sugar epimerase